MGIEKFNETYFTKEEYFLDWMDSEESQRLLQFQNHSYEQLLESYLKRYKKFKPFMRLFNPIIRKFLEAQSPYH